MNRVYNFSAGPSMLPVPVLQKAQADLLDYHGSGMSVMEMSHRSKWFDEIIQNTEAGIRKVLNVPDNYKIGFFQGGATQQFAMVPLNFMTTGTADYLVTGNFSKKAAEEAAKFGTAASLLPARIRTSPIFQMSRPLRTTPTLATSTSARTTPFLALLIKMCRRWTASPW